MAVPGYNRLIFEQATPADSQELLAILEDTTFTGNISLLYTRRPDAYQAFKHEGTEVDIIVARDIKRKRIAGVGACATRKVYVNGKSENIGYLFGLRVARDYKGVPFLHQGYAYLQTLHKEKALSYYLTTILEDNRSAQKLLEKPRSFMPTYHPFGSYEIFALKPGTRSAQRMKRRSALSGRSVNNVTFRQASERDLPTLLEFLKEQGQMYQFFPVIDKAELRAGTLHNLQIEDFYLLHTKYGEILAAGACWDQRDYKQYVVQGYHGILKGLYPISWVFPIFGYPSLPAPHTTLKFFTLSFWAIKETTPEFFLQFLAGISKVRQAYPFFLIGLHERHPFREILRQQPHISYRSKIYLVFWGAHQDALETLAREETLPYLECGML
jgi:hypothetical protein